MDVFQHTPAFQLKDLSYEYELTKIYGSDKTRMDRCASLFAEQSNHRFQMGAGIYQSGSWISGGCNERRSHARLYPYREALHAEQVAMMSARCDIEGSTIYVCRMSDDGYRLAKPCFWCMHAMIRENVYRVVYTADINTLESFKISSVSINPLENYSTETRRFR